jgi:hypothetical protein
VLSTGGAPSRYLACHVAVSWSDAAQLCGELLPGASLAVFESQVRVWGWGKVGGGGRGSSPDGSVWGGLGLTGADAVGETNCQAC